MAIAYFVPAEYGPPPNQQLPVQRKYASEPHTAMMHQQHFHQVPNISGRQEGAERNNNNKTWKNQLVSKFTDLVSELLYVMDMRNDNSERNRGKQRTPTLEKQPINKQRPAAKAPLQLDIHTFSEENTYLQDVSALPDLISTSFLPMPDIVPTEFDMSFLDSFSSSHQVIPDFQQDEAHQQPPLISFCTMSSQHPLLSSQENYLAGNRGWRIL